MTQNLSVTDFTSTTSLTLDGSAHGQTMGASFRNSLRFDVDLPIPRTIDPITGSTPYRLVLTDMYGKQYGEIENANIAQVSWSITEMGSVDFTVATDDPKVADLFVPECEVQVWRGHRMLNWYVITKARADASTVSFTGSALEWYFGRRILGEIPKTGKFKTTHFEGSGIGAWNAKVLPGTEPQAIPVFGINTDFSIVGSDSLELASSGGMTRLIFPSSDIFVDPASGTVSGTGNSLIAGFMAQTFGDQPRVNVEVYHDGNGRTAKECRVFSQERADSLANAIQAVKSQAKVVATGNGTLKPKASDVDAPQNNRYVVFSFRNSESQKGHGQYISQTYQITVPRSEKKRKAVIFRAWVYIESFVKPAANNWGMVLELQDPNVASKNPKMAAKGYKKVLQRRFQPISKDTPTGVWIRMETLVKIPSDGKEYTVEGRLFPPLGRAFFDEADLYVDDALAYYNEEQANMIRDLVKHAQDKELGKSDLNIGLNVKDTGYKRTRRYPFSDRTYILDHLTEFPTLADGMDWEVVTTPTRRTFTTFYPRKSRKTGFAFTLGENVVDFEVDVDAEQMANQIVIMENPPTDVTPAARFERSMTDLSLLDGISLEKAYEATPNSPPGSMRQQAIRGLERYRKPVVLPTLRTNPAMLDDILDAVQTGDVVAVDVRNGWFQAVGPYRVLTMSLDPQSEQLSITLAAEDTPIKRLVSYGSKWKYKDQSQAPRTGADNESPVESDENYAEVDYDDSAWLSAKAPFGWYRDGNTVSQDQSMVPTTVLAVGQEVWMRKTVQCTEEMYLSLHLDHWAYVYVNGHQIGRRDYHGHNFGQGGQWSPIRVPQKFLDPSGSQVIAVHVQAKLSIHANAESLHADVQVRGIYDPYHVVPE